MDDYVVIGLYRHGLTGANSKKQFCGWTDVEVTAEGITALKKMRVPSYEWIAASDLKRCIQTAFVFWRKKPEVIKELREFHFGEWEGKTHVELQHLHAYQNWLQDYSLQVPGGDSYASFAFRVESGFQSVLKNMEEQRIYRAAIVTHGGVVRHLLTKFAPEEKQFADWTSENGHGYELSGSLAAMRRGERCISLRAVPSMEKRNG